MAHLAVKRLRLFLLTCLLGKLRGRQITLLKEDWPIRVGLLQNAELTRRAARSYLECGPCSILPLKLQLQHFLHFPNLRCWITENQRLVIRRGSRGPFDGDGRATDPHTRIVGDSRLNPRGLNVRNFCRLIRPKMRKTNTAPAWDIYTPFYTSPN